MYVDLEVILIQFLDSSLAAQVEPTTSTPP